MESNISYSFTGAFPAYPVGSQEPADQSAVCFVFEIFSRNHCLQLPFGEEPQRGYHRQQKNICPFLVTLVSYKGFCAERRRFYLVMTLPKVSLGSNRGIFTQRMEIWKAKSCFLITKGINPSVYNSVPCTRSSFKIKKDEYKAIL